MSREAHVKPGPHGSLPNKEAGCPHLVGCGDIITPPKPNTSYTLASPVPPVHLSCHLL